MKKKAFTILEIVVICIIVGILAVLGIPFFQNVIEKSNREVCETNLKALQKALDIYIRENNEVPATIAALPQEDVNNAFTELMEEKGAWKRRLAFFIRDVREHGLVYAASEYFPRLRCPKDPTPPSAADPNAVSYGINSKIAGRSAQDYYGNLVITPVEMVILDSDSGVYDPTKGDLRHKRAGSLNSPSAYYMIGVTKAGRTGCSKDVNMLYASGCP